MSLQDSDPSASPVFVPATARNVDRFRLALAAMRALVYDLDLVSRRLNSLDGAENVLGAGPDESELSLDWWDRQIHPDDLPRCREAFERMQAEPRDHTLEYRVHHCDGRMIWVSDSAKPVLDQAGDLVRIVGAVVDISKRKQTEEQLQRNHETFYGLVQNAPFGVYVVDADFRLIEASLGSRKVFRGVDPLLGRDFAEILRIVWAEPFATEAIEKFRHTMATGETYRTADISKRRGNVEDLESYDWKIERVTLPDGRYGTVCYFYDLTERLHFEETIRQNEEQLRSALDSAKRERERLEVILATLPVGVMVTDAAGNAIMRNQSLSDIWRGKAPLGSLAEDPQYEAWDLETGRQLTSEDWPIAQVLATGQQQLKREFGFRRFDGTTGIISAVAVPVTDDQGTIIGGVSVRHDITEQRFREKNLVLIAEIERDFAASGSSAEMVKVVGQRIGNYLELDHCLFVEVDDTAQETQIFHDHHAPDVQAIVGRHRLEDFHSRAELKELSAGRPVVINSIAAEVVSGAAREGFEKLGIGALANAPYLSNGRWKFVLSGMHRRPYQWRAEEIELLTELAGRIYVRLERIRAEEALRRSQQETERQQRLYETILSNTPDFAYVIGLDHRFRYANEMLLKMWGKTLDEVAGSTFLEIGYEPWHAEMHEREVDQVVSTKRPIRGEVPFTGTFGRRIYDYIFVPVIGTDGEVEAVAGTTRDVTDRQQMEESLREGDRRKDEFLAILAHELRNPLAPIRSGLQILRRVGQDPAKFAETLEIMERQTNQIVHLVDDLLDISRITQGKIKLKKERVDLKTAIEIALETSQGFIDQAQNTLSVAIPFTPVFVHADVTRVAQIILNILNNAAKYSDPGGQISLIARSDGSNAIVEISDSGLGIEPEMLPTIFEMFGQIVTPDQEARGGLGIGLSVVKKLVEMHDGSVEAKSEGLGKGSVFTIRLPLAEVQSSERREGDAAPHEGVRKNAGLGNSSDDHARPSAGPTGRRILAVDDNLDALEMLRMLLSMEGHTVFEAIDGASALERAREIEPEVCLCDIGLPGMNGFDLALRLRKMLPDALLISISGWGREEDRKRSRESGFDFHLVKPVQIEDVLELIGQNRDSG